MTLAPGANIPIEGREAQVTVSAADLGGVLVVAEEGGTVRALAPSDPLAPVSEARVTVELGAVPARVERLRVLAFSSVKTRALEPARVSVSVDGAEVATVELATGQSLRAAELVELYRRHGQWKLRAVASGWIGGVEAASAAIGVPVAAFVPLTAGSGDEGPALLRGLVDEIVGPGARIGGPDYVEFTLPGGYAASLVLEPVGDQLSAVTAVLPLGELVAWEAAARISGEAPLGRIAFQDGHAYASASTVVDNAAVDTAVAKALLAEAWETAREYQRRAGAAMLPKAPRELRLGVAEELGEPRSWSEIRDMLRANSFLPLVDAPEACLAPADGTLWLGPVSLEGVARGWCVLCERVLRADVALNGSAWRSLASFNGLSGPLRLGVVREVGAGAQDAVVLSFSALQVQRGQPRRDLEAGLSMVDDRAAELEPGLRGLVSGTTHRNNLPWFAGRRWHGPGREVAEDVLVRELTTLPFGAPPPDGFLERVRSRDADRALAGFLAHVALIRAERGDEGWSAVASALVDMAPVELGPDGTATASIHVRRGRLQRTFASSSAGEAAPARHRGRWFAG